MEQKNEHIADHKRPNYFYSEYYHSALGHSLPQNE